MPPSFHRLLGLLAAFALVAAACGTDAPSSTEPDAQTPGEAEGPGGNGGLPEGPSALGDMFSAAFPEPLVDPAAIISGGPPPDGIPSIDDPKFVSIDEADEYLADREPVVAVEIDGDARAYPAQVLIWHEIVNDTVAGVPVVVTYCPLCNSAISYVRELRGVETTFGTSGRLFASALVMYDRATESLWTHFDGRAVVGVLAGEQLDQISSPLISWRDFKDAYPDGKVLDRERTGHTRTYGTNPYAGYDDPAGDPFLFDGDADPRLRELQRVVGIEVGDEAVAYTLEAISGVDAETAATPTTVGDLELVIFWKAGQSSALEVNTVEGGRDVGTVGVFVAEVDGMPLAFEADGEGFVDSRTGSRWNMVGTAIAGPLEGTSLERVPHLDTFWFAWSTYQPDTHLFEG